MLIMLGLLAAGFWGVAPALPASVFADDYSTVVFDRDGNVLRAYLADDEQWRLPLSEPGLPDKLTAAVLAFEDQRFLQHGGIDLRALARALVGNMRGQRLSGASTLTMQVARLAQPKARTYWGKLVEVKHAWVLEWRLSKEEILRLWLSHTPYGGNLVGAEAAARRYFGTSPWQLSWGQAAFLATLPKSPNLTFSERGRAKLRTRRNGLLQRLRRQGLIDDKVLELAQAEALPRFDFTLPFVAPHASDRLVREQPRQTTIRSTLDRELQQRASAVMRTHAQLQQQHSVENLAALVVHNESGEVRAYLGSQNFHDAAAQGQVDGVLAARSSGSILKPFLYALAIERGLMVPQTRLADVPSHYGAFTPSNHDKRFSGEVTMARALIESKNVPAVGVLAALGVHDFHALLETVGFSTLFREPDEYGLALILGGAEVNLWDLATAFRGLARGGIFEPIHLSSSTDAAAEADADRSTAPTVLSEGASRATLTVMEDLQRPGSDYYWRLFGNQRTIAWKTGTSYGHRDAWAVGVTPAWTVAVWVGNFDGIGRRTLWGSSSAAPVMFDLFALLPAAALGEESFADATLFASSPSVSSSSSSLGANNAGEASNSRVELCEETGLRATEDCPHKTLTRVPRNRIPLALCQSHQRYFIENGEGVCSLCWHGTQTSEVRLVKPARINTWLRSHGQNPQQPPRHRSTCPSVHTERALVLTQPSENATLFIPRLGAKEHGAVVLRAVHQREDATLYWYLDGHYLGQTEKRHQTSTVLQPGAHELRVVDDRGLFQERHFRAQWRHEG